jgi:hypothetical protein
MVTDTSLVSQWKRRTEPLPLSDRSSVTSINKSILFFLALGSFSRICGTLLSTPASLLNIKAFYSHLAPVSSLSPSGKMMFHTRRHFLISKYPIIIWRRWFAMGSFSSHCHDPPSVLLSLNIKMFYPHLASGIWIYEPNRQPRCHYHTFASSLAWCLSISTKLIGCCLWISQSL